jgi:phosphoribosyl 1,2-cyclic phosphate phosphodiesterase
MFLNVVYLSDVSRIPEETQKLISKNELELLVVDVLRPNPPHKSHFDLNQAIELIKTLKPKKSLLVGMGHEIDHNSTNQLLFDLKESYGIDVELAFDGMIYNVTL